MFKLAENLCIHHSCSYNIIAPVEENNVFRRIIMCLGGKFRLMHTKLCKVNDLITAKTQTIHAKIMPLILFNECLSRLPIRRGPLENLYAARMKRSLSRSSQELIIIDMHERLAANHLNHSNTKITSMSEHKDFHSDLGGEIKKFFNFPFFSLTLEWNIFPQLCRI